RRIGEAVERIGEHRSGGVGPHRLGPTLLVPHRLLQEQEVDVGGDLTEHGDTALRQRRHPGEGGRVVGLLRPGHVLGVQTRAWRRARTGFTVRRAGAWPDPASFRDGLTARPVLWWDTGRRSPAP